MLLLMSKHVDIQRVGLCFKETDLNDTGFGCGKILIFDG